VSVPATPGARMSRVTPKDAGLGLPPTRLSTVSFQADRVVSRNGDITVIFDSPPAVLLRAERSRQGRIERHRRSRGAFRTATLWGLGLAEGVLVVGGLGVLLSCWFVAGSGAATDRAYLGIALVFAGALVAVPATALIGQRGARGSSAPPRGRHRRS